jgi:putative membrane protein
LHLLEKVVKLAHLYAPSWLRAVRVALQEFLMIPYPRGGWLRFLVAPHGSFVRGVPLRVLAFGVIAAIAWAGDRYLSLHLPIGPHEIAGAIIALILAFRTNTAYNRFWEGRTLWGAIVNSCRNLTRIAMHHSGQDSVEARAFATWVVVFAHSSRRWLRGETDWPEIQALLPADAYEVLVRSPHPPLHAADELSRHVAALVRRGSLDPMMAASAEGEIVALVNCLGGCERIRKTPTPLGYVVLSQRLIAITLASLPFALIEQVGALTPLITMTVAYPILLIEGLGTELDNPFGHDVNDLPLTRICKTIEENLLAAPPTPDDMPPTATYYFD